MIDVLASIVGALAAGALSKVEEAGGEVVTASYESLRGLIVRKLGKGGAVQSVEDEPRSEIAQAALAEALARANLVGDPELARHAEALRAVLAVAVRPDGADIEVGDVIAKVNVLINNLVADGRIKTGNIRGGGDVTLTNLTAGAGASKKA